MGLEFHHEVAYDQQPPRHLALHCRRNEGLAKRGGNLLLCDAPSVIRELEHSSVLTRADLRSTLFVNDIFADQPALPLTRSIRTRPHFDDDDDDDDDNDDDNAVVGDALPSETEYFGDGDDSYTADRFIYSAIGGANGHQSTYFHPAPGHEAKGDAVLERVVPALLECRGGRPRRIEWQTGDLVILDNHRVMHARLALEPAAADEDRNIAHLRIA
eukprot:g4107.t1